MINKAKIQQRMVEAVQTVRRMNPMAGSITNTVTINFVANAQLAVGGSAAMVYLPDEGAFLAKSGGATYVNVGTLMPIYEETLPHVAKVLFDENKPWVLDPVAIGIGEMRTDLLRKFKQYKPSVIRGNASEVIALAGLWGLTESGKVSTVRGVDATNSVIAAKEAAVAIANWTGGAVAVSGEVDLVTDGKVIVRSHGGSNFMEKVTGMGCSLGGVVAVYAAVTTPFIAALTGTAVYNLAGELAGRNSRGTGSFQVNFIDELSVATAEEIASQPFEMEEM